MAAVRYNRIEKTLAVHAELDLKRLDAAFRRLKRLAVFALSSSALLLSPAGEQGHTTTEADREPVPTIESPGLFILPTIIEIANLSGEVIPTPSFPTYSIVPDAFIDRRSSAQIHEQPNADDTLPVLPTITALAGMDAPADEPFQRAPVDRSD